MRKLRFWLGITLALCGAGYAILALIAVGESNGNVADVRSWTEFGLGVAMAACGSTMAILTRRRAAKHDENP